MSFLRNTNHLVFNLLAAGTLAMIACANPVAPTGGPKDTTPPEIIRSVPENQSVNFSSDRVTITFSEFVNLKDINTQLMVSPPLSEQPDFLMKGKTLTMKFREALRENTTYNFFFGDAIVDITESNPIPGYSFTFSTGPVIDSLSMSGKVLNAFTLQPVKGAFVMLYDSISDSIPYKSRPYYVARTSESGEFRLNNLRSNKYLMFALTDINSNYIYDMPTEDIGFSDTLVEPDLPSEKIAELVPGSEETLPDTLKADSADVKPIQSAPDTIHQEQGDSLAVTAPAVKVSHVKNYLIYQFRETDTIQRLLKGTVIRENVIGLYFRQPVRNLHIKPLDPSLEGEWNLTGYNATRDSLTLWIPGSGTDSLMIEVSDNGIVLDTLDLALTPAARNTGKDKSTVVKKKALEMRPNLISSKIKPGRPLILSVADPVKEADLSRIRLYHDSLEVKPVITFSDSLKTRLHISHSWKEAESYLLKVNDSALISVFGQANDSTAYKFKALSEEETGFIKINITVPDQEKGYIIQLLGDKESILEQHRITGNAILEFKYLSPKKYRFKAIYDLNNNGRWDTGNYLDKLQPEPVSYFSKEIELRANWTMEEDWSLD